MRALLWLTMLTMGLAVPATGKSELETLRDRCAQQERQIRRLKAENERLREGKSDTPSTSTHASKEADSPKSTKSESKSDTSKTAKSESKSDSPKTAKSDTPKASSSKGTKSGSTSGSSGSGTYTVRQGDSFDRIAHKNGTTAERVAEANNMELTTMIHPGQKLVLPPKGSGRSSSGRTASHSSTESKSSKPADKPSKSVTRAADEDPPAETPPPPVPKATPKSTPGTVASHPPATHKTAPEAAAPPPPADPPTPAVKTVDKRKTHAVKIENEMTYGEFAAKHGTDTNRLNDLNGLDLPKSSVLAKGSELYVPGQP